MNIFKITIFTITAAFSLILLKPASFAQNNTPPVSKVTIEASILKPQVEVGEPIPIQLVVRNLSDEMTTFASSLSYVGDMKIMIYRPRRLPLEFRGLGKSGMTPDISFRLRPGEVRYHYFYITYDQESETGYLFDSPQKVEIDFTLEYGAVGGKKDKKFKSENMVVEIVPPSPASEKGHEILNNKTGALVMQTLALNADSIGMVTKALNNTAEESPLRPYLLAALARYHGVALGSDMDTMIGLDYANRLLTTYPDSYLADDSLMIQAMIQDKTGMEDEAKRTLVKLYNTYPDSEYIGEGNPLYVKYFNLEPSIDTMVPSGDIIWMMRP